MSRPVVTVGELLADLGCELPRTSIRSYLGRDTDATLNTVVSPATLVWVMGSGWSSYVAQSLMVSLCQAAGFSPIQLLTEEGCLPSVGTPSIAIATDDIMHFWLGSPGAKVQVVVPPLGRPGHHLLKFQSLRLDTFSRCVES